MTFRPRFHYTDALVGNLGAIETARAVVDLLPLPPDASLRMQHDALYHSVRSSTRIEGNVLDDGAIRHAIATGPRVGSEAEQEVRNYWRALTWLDGITEGGRPLAESHILELHALVIVKGAGRRAKRSDYRSAECPVVDTATRQIDYGPPGPRDVPGLVGDLVAWLNDAGTATLPAVVRAGILSHRFISIHPFDDGNGRTGRLLATTFIAFIAPGL